VLSDLYVEVGDGKVQLKEFRTEQEVAEDEVLIYNAETQQSDDLNKLFTIINHGFFYTEGIQSWY
jgi:hypothetical protein